MKKMFLKETKAITLIALVVTIIVLIILAAVSINLILGQNGILTKTREGRENYELASEEEQTGLNSLFDELERKTSGEDNDEVDEDIDTENWTTAWVQEANGWSEGYKQGEITDEELEAKGNIVAKVYNIGTYTDVSQYPYYSGKYKSLRLEITGTGEMSDLFWEDDWGVSGRAHGDAWLGNWDDPVYGNNNGWRL